MQFPISNPSKTTALAFFVSLIAVPTLTQADHTNINIAPRVVLGNITIELEVIADENNSAMVNPLSVKHARDGSGRLFIGDQVGQIWVVAADGDVLDTPFLDLTNSELSPRDQIPVDQIGGDERGLLGLAFHPDYANNGRFFVRYGVPRPGTSSEDCWDGSRGCHRERVAEFAVSGDPNVADPQPVKIIFEVDQPESNHNGGDIEFGPDGYLYFALGDGGGSADRTDRDYLPHGMFGNGQTIGGPLAAPQNASLGAMLRIDVDSFEPFNSDGRVPYGIPADNPFVSDEPGINSRESYEMDEIWAYGLRNPWRFSFDRQDGRLFLADVGQGLFEEVNIIERGGNYGWNDKEGSYCFNDQDRNNPDIILECPDVGMGGEPLIDPITEYEHSDGHSIAGGYVYRGSQSPILFGKYIFGDLSTVGSEPKGRLFYIDADGGFPVVPNEFRLKAGTPNAASGYGPFTGEFVLGFGEGEDGEVYAATTVFRAFPQFEQFGHVYRVVQSSDTDDDGVGDEADNCSQLANLDQTDSDGDGFGNRCDPDLNQDNFVNFLDLNIFRDAIFSTPADATWNPDADFNADDIVNLADAQIVNQFFFGSPGPGVAD